MFDDLIVRVMWESLHREGIETRCDRIASNDRKMYKPMLLDLSERANGDMHLEKSHTKLFVIEVHFWCCSSEITMEDLIEFLVMKILLIERREGEK